MHSKSTNNEASSSTKALFLGCFYTFFVNGGLALILGSILPFMSETYDLNYKITGLLLSFHSIGNLVSSFISGLVPLYIGRKKSIMMFCSLGIIAFTTMAITGNPILLLLAFFLTGLNRGAVSNFNNTVVNDIATGKAWALNLLHSIFSIGAFLAPFVAILVTKNNPDGWIYAVLIWAVLAFTQVVVYGRMNIPNNYPVKEKKGNKKIDFSFLKNKYFLTAAGILFSYLCAEQAFNGWLVTYFKDSGIMGTSLAQSMSSLLWIVILIGRLVTAAISNKIKKSKLLLFNAIGYFIFIIFLISSRTVTPAVIGIIGTGFFMAGIYPTTISSAGKLLKDYPLALSFLLTIAGMGSILMPYIIGNVADAIGIIGGMSVVAIAVVITLLLIIYNSFIYRKIEE
ncbi:MAG: MFS transporter [Clostridiales bacterium]|nr:MFS transporter [Clostridiales bacterium]